MEAQAENLIFERAARELEPRVRFAKVNTDDAGPLAVRFGIRCIPTLIIFKRGKEIARVSGAMDAARLVQWVRGNQ